MQTGLHKRGPSLRRAFKRALALTPLWAVQCRVVRAADPALARLVVWPDDVACVAHPLHTWLRAALLAIVGAADLPLLRVDESKAVAFEVCRDGALRSTLLVALTLIHSRVLPGLPGAEGVCRCRLVLHVP